MSLIEQFTLQLGLWRAFGWCGLCMLQAYLPWLKWKRPFHTVVGAVDISESSYFENAYLVVVPAMQTLSLQMMLITMHEVFQVLDSSCRSQFSGDRRLWDARCCHLQGLYSIAGQWLKILMTKAVLMTKADLWHGLTPDAIYPAAVLERPRVSLRSCHLQVVRRIS